MMLCRTHHGESSSSMTHPHETSSPADLPALHSWCRWMLIVHKIPGQRSSHHAYCSIYGAEMILEQQCTCCNGSAAAEYASRCWLQVFDGFSASSRRLSAWEDRI